MRGGDNKAVVRRFWREVLERGELDAADGIFARGHTVNLPLSPKNGRGPNAMKAIAGVFRRLSPDLRVSIEDEISEGEKVVTLWTVRGRAADQTEDPGDPGVVVSGVAVFRVSDGEIQETWLRFQSHDQGPRRVPKDARLRSELSEDPLFEPLGEAAAFNFKCWFRPRTCRTVQTAPQG